MIELNNLISPTDPLKPYVKIFSARAINEHGQIAANGVDSRIGLAHGYLLNPVPTVDQLLEALLAEVIGVGPGKSLEDKVRLAQTYYAVPDIPATCAVLTGLVNQVQAQRGKTISPVVAGKLIADAKVIMTAIGCH